MLPIISIETLKTTFATFLKDIKRGDYLKDMAEDQPGIFAFLTNLHETVENQPTTKREMFIIGAILMHKMLKRQAEIDELEKQQ